MAPATEEQTGDLRCRLHLTLETGDGEPVVDLEVDDLLRGALDEEFIGRLPHRVAQVLESRLLPALRRDLRGWLDAQLPAEIGSFEDEFCRRVDCNDDTIAALDWMHPEQESDEQREWTARMASIFMARTENERVS